MHAATGTIGATGTLATGSTAGASTGSGSGSAAATASGAAGSAGAGSAGVGTAAIGAAPTGAQAGAQAAGAQAAFAPQKPQLNCPQRFPTAHGLAAHGCTVAQGFTQGFTQAGAAQPQAGAGVAQTGAHGLAQGLGPKMQLSKYRFLPGYQLPLQAGASYVVRGWNKGFRHGREHGWQPTFWQQQELIVLPQVEQLG